LAGSRLAILTKIEVSPSQPFGSQIDGRFSSGSDLASQFLQAVHKVATPSFGRQWVNQAV
jgi:hypothetical protein